MNEMTAEKAQEALNTLEKIADATFPHFNKSMQLPISILRRVASGELAEVVHAHWIPVAKECYDITDDEQYPAYKYCSHCKISQKWPDHFNHCPNCGADMRQTEDGKDDSHAD